ncbi:unnamed protein product [Nesidiocoris tenuis]|uniref:Uncharacterized protein n=1 Tax=Nesidiocoris tenuis TaxID=355587 RepID=A0A6H5GYX7_9HEMI|nr:unnamed protein product [Nesidiocoris tenuis]
MSSICWTSRSNCLATMVFRLLRPPLPHRLPQSPLGALAIPAVGQRPMSSRSHHLPRTCLLLPPDPPPRRIIRAADSWFESSKKKKYSHTFGQKTLNCDSVGEPVQKNVQVSLNVFYLRTTAWQRIHQDPFPLILTTWKTSSSSVPILDFRTITILPFTLSTANGNSILKRLRICVKHGVDQNGDPVLFCFHFHDRCSMEAIDCSSSSKSIDFIMAQRRMFDCQSSSVRRPPPCAARPPRRPISVLPLASVDSPRSAASLVTAPAVASRPRRSPARIRCRIFETGRERS